MTDIPPKKLWSLLADRTGFFLRSARRNAATKLQPNTEADMAQSFATFFNNKTKDINQQLLSHSAQMPQTDDATLAGTLMHVFEPTNPKEISVHLAKLKKKTSPNDVFPNRLLTAEKDVIPFFTFICNRSFDEGTFPDVLKEAIITPVLKKPQLDPDIPSNYRPISNLAVLGKLLECIASARLTTHLEKVNYIHRNQSAYRRYHSTETATLRVSSDWRTALDLGKVVLVVSLDVTAAFDTVHHPTLLQKLINAGIIGKAHCWFTTYLKDRLATVKFGGAKSCAYPLLSGVPQGSVLGPLLFNLYMSDLARLLQAQDVNFHIYADDVIIYIACPPACLINTTMKVQLILGLVEKWMSCHNLLLSSSKTGAFLLHCNAKQLIHPLPHLIVSGNTVTLDTSSTFRWLGVDFDPGLTMCDFIGRTCCTCFMILRMLRQTRQSLNKSSAILLCNALVCSRIDYCCSLLVVADNTQTARLQSVLNLAARVISGRRKFDHISHVIHELQWPVVPIRIERRVQELVAKALNGVAPEYLAEELNIYIPRRSLRSSKSCSTTLVLGTAKKCIGRGAWSVAAPKFWNQLPENVRTRHPKSSKFILNFT
jgi:hypothetical protein